MLAWFAAYDLVLCPVFPDPARRHGDMNRPGERDPTSYTTPYSLTGWPAATVCCETSPEGLPIGVQLVARPWRDDLALAAAQELERAHGGWRPPNINAGIEEGGAGAPAAPPSCPAIAWRW